MAIAEKLTTIAENIPKVFEAGKDAEHKEFWDGVTNSGTRTSWRYACAGYGWTDETFKPPETIFPQDARYMFQNSAVTSIDETQVDFTNATDMRDAFSYCEFLVNLKLKINGNKTFNANTFVGCTALTNLTIIGTIQSNNFNVQWSENLTHDSLMSIINALADKTGVSGSWTVTLGDVNIAKLTDAEQQIAHQKGWNIS